MNELKEADNPREIDDPDDIECEGCGNPVGHDEFIHTTIKGYNMHGQVMDLPSADIKLACRRCMSKVFSDVGRRCYSCHEPMTYNDGWECQKGGCEGA